LHGGYSQGKKSAVSKDTKEKGPLWGTKPTFFRRKEIRVSLLFFIMQVLCQFLIYYKLTCKPLLREDFPIFFLFNEKSAKYNFLYFAQLHYAILPNLFLFYPYNIKNIATS